MDGLVVWDRLVLRAILRLQGHHSASQLPQLALHKRRQELSRRRPASRVATDDMAEAPRVKGQSWWCTACRKFVRHTAAFCPDCGKPWRVVAYSGSVEDCGWQDNQETDWQHPWPVRGVSPRPRREKSPRERSKGEPKGKGKGKGGKEQGKTKATTSAALGAKELLAALPRAPSATQVTMPAASSSSEGAERSPAMSDLMQALAAVKDDLPPSVRVALQSHMEEDAKMSSKGFHKLVSQQGQAKKELLAIRGAREQFLQEWASYIGALSELLAKLQAKAENLRKLEESEEKWMQQLHNTTRAITLSSQMDEVVDVEDMDTAVDDDAAREPAKTEAAHRALAVEASLSEALQKAKAAPNHEAGATRERSVGRDDPKEAKESKTQVSPWQGPVTTPLGFTGPDASRGTTGVLGEIVTMSRHGGPVSWACAPQRK